MDHIPVEILHHIFIQLELKDRLECMLVCRFWYDTLDGRSLLHSLYIPSGRFHRVKDMLERLSYRNTQVERLIIDVDSDFDKRKICNMFPNLRQLDLQQGNMERIRPQNYLNTKFFFLFIQQLNWRELVIAVIANWLVNLPCRIYVDLSTFLSLISHHCLNQPPPTSCLS